MPRSRSRSLESRICSPDELGFAKLAALAQHAVDQGGLAVVDVGDDGHVADVVASHGLQSVGWAPLKMVETIQATSQEGS